MRSPKGTTPGGSPPEGPGRPGPGLVVVLLLLGFLVASGGAGAPASAATPLATLTLTTLDPAVGTPGAVLHVAGSVRTGRERLRNVSVALRLSRTPVNSRDELAGVASGLTTGKDGDADRVGSRSPTC